MIDLSRATFLDCTAIRMLLYAIAPLRDEADAAVVLAGVEGVVARALAVSGIRAMFTVFDTAESAISGLSARSPSLDGSWRSVDPTGYRSL